MATSFTVDEYFAELAKKYEVTEQVNVYDVNGDVRASVINPFTADFERYLATRLNDGKYPNLIYSDHMGSEMTAVQDHQVENFKELVAYYPINTASTIEREIALYRNYQMTGNPAVSGIDAELVKTLFLEYMLKTFVCYIECFGAMGTVHKYIGTRNIKLIGKLVPGLETNEVKLKTLKAGLSMRYEDIQNGLLPFYPLKVDKKAEKNGILRFADVGRKANLFTIGNIIRVIPVSLYSAYAKRLMSFDGYMKDNFVQVVYLKDNGTLRSIITSLNTAKINSIYGDTDLTKKMLSSCKIAWDRGYISVPDLTLSRNQAVDDACRAINIGRIVRVTVLSNYVNEYVDKDISNTLNTFTNYVNVNIDNKEWLDRVCAELGFANNTTVTVNLTNAYSVANYIKLMTAKEFERDAHGYGILLHNYMLKYASEFGNYTGNLI